MKRGDVVILDFPFTDVPGSKVRPALVIQKDHYNTRLPKTIVAMITGNLKRAGEPTHQLIDPATPDGSRSGLSGPSLVTCVNLYTVEQTSVLRVIGSLPASMMQKVNDCLRVALDLP
jgi:mRNA interferase MazF